MPITLILQPPDIQIKANITDVINLADEGLIYGKFLNGPFFKLIISDQTLNVEMISAYKCAV